MNGSACRMDDQSTLEKKMTLAQKRKHYCCDKYHFPCSNCPIYHPKEKTHAKKTRAKKV